MYRYHCQTCGTSEVLEELEAAQSAFVTHAEEQHEVVLSRIDGQDGGPAPSIEVEPETTDADPRPSTNPE